MTIAPSDKVFAKLKLFEVTADAPTIIALRDVCSGHDIDAAAKSAITPLQFAMLTPKATSLIASLEPDSDCKEIRKASNVFSKELDLIISYLGGPTAVDASEYSMGYGERSLELNIDYLQPGVSQRGDGWHVDGMPINTTVIMEKQVTVGRLLIPIINGAKSGICTTYLDKPATPKMIDYLNSDVTGIPEQDLFRLFPDHRTIPANDNSMSFIFAGIDPHRGAPNTTGIIRRREFMRYK